MCYVNINPKNDTTSFASNNFSNKNALNNLINYVYKPSKTPSQMYGFYKVLPDPQYVANSFFAISSLYHKNLPDKRQAEHFIISFTPEEIRALTSQGIIECIHSFCLLISRNYQCCLAIHEDTDVLHAHVVINPVSYVTGNRMHKARGLHNGGTYTI